MNDANGSAVLRSRRTNHHHRFLSYVQANAWFEWSSRGSRHDASTPLGWWAAYHCTVKQQVPHRQRGQKTERIRTSPQFALRSQGPVNSYSLIQKHSAVSRKRMLRIKRWPCMTWRSFAIIRRITLLPNSTPTIKTLSSGWNPFLSSTWNFRP